MKFYFAICSPISSPYIDSTRHLSSTGCLKVADLNLAPRKASLTVNTQAFFRSKKVFKSDNLVRSATTTAAPPINQLSSLSIDIPILSRSENCVIDSQCAPFEVNLDKSGFNYLRDSTKSEENILNYSKCISLSENSLNASKCSSSKDIYSSHDSDSTDFIKSGENVSQFEYSSKSESDISNHRVSLPEDELLRVNFIFFLIVLLQIGFFFSQIPFCNFLTFCFIEVFLLFLCS